MAVSVNAHIDLTGITTIEDFHKRIREAVTIPDHYGDNLDSLYDIMTEMSGRIMIRGSETVDEDMVVYVDRFKAMCTDVQASNPLLDIVFG